MIKYLLIIFFIVILAFVALVIIHPPLPIFIQPNSSGQQTNGNGWFGRVNQPEDDNRYQTLVGTWYTNKDVAYSPLVTLMFEPGKKGIKYELQNNNYMASNFTYKFNGDTLELTAAGEKPREFQFTLALEGNKMVLTENGKAVTYIRPGIATGTSNKY